MRSLLVDTETLGRLKVISGPPLWKPNTKRRIATSRDLQKLRKTVLLSPMQTSRFFDKRDTILEREPPLGEGGGLKGGVRLKEGVRKDMMLGGAMRPGCPSALSRETELKQKAIMRCEKFRKLFYSAQGRKHKRFVLKSIRY